MNHIDSQIYAVREGNWLEVRLTLDRINDRLTAIEIQLNRLDGQIAELQARKP